MPISSDEAQQYRAHDRRAVYVGAVITAVATLVFFVLPEILPADSFKDWLFDQTGIWIRDDNPFTPLRLLGVTVGTAVAGGLTSEFGSGAMAGLKSAVYGLLLAYLLTITIYFIYSIFVINIFPPAVINILVTPAVFAVPLFPVYVVGGLTIGFLFDRLF